MKVRYLFVRLNLAVLVFIMAGCVHLPPVPSPPPVSLSPQLSLLRSVVEQLHTAQKMSPEKITAELLALEQAYARMPNVHNRLRLAVSLGFGKCKKCDSDRALKLFKKTPESNQENLVVALVALSIELLESKAVIEEKDSGLLRQQQQVKQLQQKLDDLTSIEESLHLRK